MGKLLKKIEELVRQWDATGISNAGEILKKISEVEAEHRALLAVYHGDQYEKAAYGGADHH